jgi:hypothetical protein
MTKNTNSILTLILATNIRRLILLVVLSCSAVVSAQGVLSGSQTGTIEGMHQSDDYLTISGRNYGFHNDVTHVFYDGEEVATNFLNEGLVVRFVVNRDGVLARIEVLGPLNLIKALIES